MSRSSFALNFTCLSPVLPFRTVRQRVNVILLITDISTICFLALAGGWWNVFKSGVLSCANVGAYCFANMTESQNESSTRYPCGVCADEVADFEARAVACNSCDR